MLVLGSDFLISGDPEELVRKKFALYELKQKDFLKNLSLDFWKNYWAISISYVTYESIEYYKFLNLKFIHLNF